MKRKRSDFKNSPIDLRLANLPTCPILKIKKNESKPVNKDAQLIVSKNKNN